MLGARRQRAAAAARPAPLAPGRGQRAAGRRAVGAARLPRPVPPRRARRVASAAAAAVLAGAAARRRRRAHRRRPRARIAASCGSRCCAASPRPTALLLAARARCSAAPGCAAATRVLLAGAVLDDELERPRVHRRGRDRPAARAPGTAMSLQNTIVSVAARRRRPAVRRARRGDVLAGRPGRRSPLAPLGGAARPRPARARGGRAPRRARQRLAVRRRRLPSATSPDIGARERHRAEPERGPVRPRGRRRLRHEIAEPDKEGGALRYRGVDIEDLVGQVPYEKVWGLLVDGTLRPRPAARRAAPAAPSARGDPRVDVQAGAGDARPRVGLRAAHRHRRRAGARPTSRARRSWRCPSSRSPRAGIGAPAGAAARGRRGGVDPRALPDPLARRGRPRPRQGDRRLLDLAPPSTA